MKVKHLHWKRSLRTVLLVLLLNAVGMTKEYAQNLIANGDFESYNIYGQITAPSYTDYQRVNGPYVVEFGHYVIDNTTNGHGGGYFGWPSVQGHGGSGKFMMVNGYGGITNPTKVVWKQTVSVNPNTLYNFSCFVVNFNRVIYGQINPAMLQLKINGVAVGGENQLPQNNEWREWTHTWESGTATQATIEIYDHYTGEEGLGDNFGLDDISFSVLAQYSVNAVDDNASVCLYSSVQVDVLANDILLPNAQGAVVTITQQPAYGSASVTSNNRISYLFMDPSHIGDVDQVKYKITIPHGEYDEAWLYISTVTTPNVGWIDNPGPICAGGALGIDEPTVTPFALGQWEKSQTQNGIYMAIDPTNIPLSMNGWWVRYTATNDCGEGSSNAVQIMVTNGPSFTGQTPPISPIYAGGSLNITAPAYNSNGSQIFSQGWVISQTENGTYTTFNNNSLNNIPASYNGWYIRYMVEGSCGFIYSQPARQLIVYPNDNNIIFADANVKSLCVANWDTNGDGEMSYSEAASVTDLGYYFHGNSQIISFDELQFFTGLTSIGYYAFSGCSGLTSLTIPNSVTSIVTEAFRGCSGLTSLTIPNSVTWIGYEAFTGCGGLEQIIVDEDNPSYDSRENCNAIIETSTNTLIKGCKNTIIPNSVTSIGDDSFSHCSGLTNLTIPNSVTSIGDDAFYGCSGLTSLTIPNSVTSIGYYAFGLCSGLTSLNLGNSVASISYGAFRGCSGLTSLTVPNSVTSIGDDAFSGCSGLEQIIVDEDNPSYDSRESCNAIIETSTNTLITGCKNTIIPNSVISIGDYAFYGCSGLTSLAIPDSVTTIGGSAFSGCSGLTSLDLGNSVTSIGDYAFGYCSGLSTITVLAETPPTLGSGVFYNLDTSLPVYVPCSSISDYQSSAGWNEFTNYQPATTCASGEITVTVNPTEGGTVTGTGYYEGGTLCTLTAIPNEGFSFLNWMENGTIVSNNSEYSFVVSGDRELVANFVEGEWCTVIFELFDSYGDGYTGNYLVVTDENESHQLTVESGSSAVYTLPFLTGSHITLTWIVGSYSGDCSFTVSYSNGNVICHGENLNENYNFEFDVDCNLAPIDNIVFADPNVKALCIANWDTDGDGELSYDEAAVVTDLGQVFRENTEITSFEELQYFTGLTTINYYAFYNCSSLSGSLYIPNSVTTIGSGAFYGCSGLTGSLTIPNSVTTIGSLAFYGCSGFTGGLTIGNSVTMIGNCAFEHCSGFTGSLDIPNSVTSIGIQAFNNCSGFSGNLTISNSVTTIGKYTFGHCNGFTGELIIPNSVTSIGYGAFWGCSGFTGSLTIGNAVTTIDDNAFCSCNGFTGNLTIPNTVTMIGNYAFEHCSGFTGNLTISNSLTSIGDGVFMYTNFTGKLTIPNSVTSIGYGAFWACSDFSGALTLGSSVTTIGNRAFYLCSGLSGSLTIPSSVTSIGDEAFYGCNGFMEALMLGIIPLSLGSNVFHSSYYNYPIYVPYESLNDYKSATNWSDYEDRIFPMTYKTISGYGESEGNWQFIASPLMENTDPTAVNNMITETAYDLYEFNQSATDGEWQNYKANTEDFVLENGQGYLYANAEDVNIIFKGAFNEDETKEVNLVYDGNVDFAGWNLVGNPFPVSAYANKSYYTMNDDGTGIEPVAVSTAMAIAPCIGVMVEAEGTGESVIFSKTVPEMAANQGNVQIAVAENTLNRDGIATVSTTLLDKVIVSFNMGEQLEKFVFNKGNASLSIPQGGKDFAIACAEKQGEMPLNFKAVKNGSYTLSVNIENAELEYLHLIDNMTGADVDLLATPSYTFEAKTSGYASRFRLVFNANETDGPSTGSGTFAFISNGNIIVTDAEADAVLQIVDEMGRVLVSCKGDAMNRVSTSGMTPGVYVLCLIQGENMKTQKIVVW